MVINAKTNSTRDEEKHVGEHAPVVLCLERDLIEEADYFILWGASTLLFLQKYFWLFLTVYRLGILYFSSSMSMNNTKDFKRNSNCKAEEVNIVETTNMKLCSKCKGKKNQGVFLKPLLQRTMKCDAEMSRLTLGDMTHHKVICSDRGDTSSGTESRDFQQHGVLSKPDLLHMGAN